MAVGGARPRDLQARDPHTSQIAAVTQAYLATSMVRRHGAPNSSDIRQLCITSTAALEIPPPLPSSIETVERDPLRPVVRPVLSRSSRGPPRS